jgi:LysM repeat protein
MQTTDDGQESESAAGSAGETMPPATMPEPDKGYEYVIQKGDSLATIVMKFHQAGTEVTREAVLAANPGLDPARLRVGQKVFVPLGAH